MINKLKICYFGGEPIGVPVLNELKKAEILPDLIVSNQDKPIGRKQTLTSSKTAFWAEENNIELFQPENLKNKDGLEKITSVAWDLFIVVAYGKILPKWLIDIPKHGTLNIHPSLLPTLRGASPIRSAILENKRETGVTIMLMDEDIDHGPIVAQESLLIDKKDWPIDGQKLDSILATLGGKLLVKTIPKWIDRDIEEVVQNHNEATFSTKITKSMGELSINPKELPRGDGAYNMLLKIRAFSGWPETFFMHNKKRVKIKNAELDESGALKIISVVPEGKKEMPFENYRKNL